MTWEDPGATALVVVVPEAEELVGHLRRTHTPSGREGMPAHVTLLAPFVPLRELDADAVRAVCARFMPFGFELRRTARFDDIGVLYLAPEPAEPFVELISALADAFPAYRPPFETIVPHVTVARQPESRQLDAIAAAVDPRLPVAARAEEVVVFERGRDGRWSEQSRFPLGLWLRVDSSSPEETERIAGELAETLRVGDVVTVSGELGSGKTTFVRGACRALGVTEPVTSPTFTIGHRYRGRVDVSHLDLYRFAGVSSAEWGDLEPYFDDAIAFVEWPEAAGETLGLVRAAVRLEHRSPSERLISIDAREPLLGTVLPGAPRSV